MTQPLRNYLSATRVQGTPTPVGGLTADQVRDLVGAMFDGFAAFTYDSQTRTLAFVLTDPDIPADIARDTEVDAEVKAEARLRTEGDDIQAIVIASNANLTSALTAQAGATTALIAEVTADVVVNHSGSRHEYSAGDVLYFTPKSTAAETLFNKRDASSHTRLDALDRHNKLPRIRVYPESIKSTNQIAGNYEVSLDNVVEEIFIGPDPFNPITPEISRFKLTEISNERPVDVHNSGWLFAGAEYRFNVEISDAEAQAIFDQSPDTFLVFVGEFSNRDRSVVIRTNEFTIPIGDVEGFPSTREEVGRISEDVAHNRNLLADMEQEEFVRWATSAPGDGTFLVFPSSSGGSYSQPILQVPDPTKALTGVGWVNQWVRPDPGANPGYDVTDVNAWQNLFSIIVRLKHRSSQADFRVLLPGALRNSPIGQMSSSTWVSFHSDADWDYYLYSVASALPQNVSLSDFYVPVGDGYTLQHHGPQRHTIYRGRVQALEEYAPHSPRRVTQLPHYMLEDEILVLTQDALHPATEQRWDFTPDAVTGFNADSGVYDNRYVGVAIPNAVDTSIGDTSGSPRNNGAAGWGSDLSAIFQTAGIRAMYARTTEEDTLYVVVDKGLISDADAVRPGNYRLSLLLPLDGRPGSSSSFWSRSVVADAITTQAATRTLAFTITGVRSQLSLQSFAVIVPGGTGPSVSLRHNTDYLRINSGTVEFSGAGVAMEKGLYRGKKDGTPERVYLRTTPEPSGLAAISYNAALKIDWNDGQMRSVTLTGNTTVSFDNVKAGSVLVLEVTQDSTGSRTITWPASVEWASGSAEGPSDGGGDVDVFTLLALTGNRIVASAALDVS